MKGTVKPYDTAAGVRWRWAWTEYLIDGRKHQHSGKGLRLKKDADEALRKSLARYDTGQRTSPDLNLTLSAWLDIYAAERAGSPTTSRDDRTAINRIVPVLGAKALRKLEHGDIDYLTTRLREPGADKRSNTPKPLGEGSISRTFNFLSGALREAVRRGKMSQNPCVNATHPRPPKHTIGDWSVEELNGFLAQRQASGDRLLPLWRLAAYTGMRRSELLGLGWTRLNLDRAYLSMTSTRVQIGQEMHDGTGKSDSAERRLDLDPETVEILRAWREVQELELLTLGVVATGHVFTDEKGEPWTASIVGNRWRTAVRESGLRKIPFKDLRSTHGTVLAEQGAHPKVISARMGHSDEAFSLKRYVKATPGMQADAARIFSEAMNTVTTTPTTPGVEEILALLAKATPEVQAEILLRLATAAEARSWTV